MPKKSYGVGILIFVLFLSISIVSATTTVYVDPSNSIIKAGENVVISVGINTDENIYAMSFDLFFNNSVLEAISSSEGGFLGKDGKNVLVAVNNIDNTAGKFSFAATRSGQVGGVIGSGAVANITFKAISNLGQSNLVINNVQISGPNLNPISSNIVNGVITINNPPTASNLQLIPSQPKTTDNLQSTYNYFDADGHAESGTEIKWYKNGVLQSAYDNLKTLPSSATNKGEKWYFTIRPKDGISFGSLQTSPTVTIQNSAPVLQSIGNKNINEGQLLQFTVSASDSDNDVLTYTVDGLPPGASFVGQQFSWTPTFDQAGVYQVTFNVNDGEEIDSETITITVKNVDRAPTIDWFSPSSLVLSLREGFSLLFNHTSSDLDGDTLDYSWKLNTVEKATTQDWIFTPNENQCGQHEVKLEVSDGQLLVSQLWSVTVNLRGDVDLDGDADIFDLASVGLSYRTQEGDEGWNVQADIFPGPTMNGEPEGDGKVDIFDLAMVGLNYGRSCF